MLRSFALAALTGRRLAGLDAAATGSGGLVAAALRSASSSAPPPPPPPPDATSPSDPSTTTAEAAPPPPEADPIATLLRRLGTARSCTRRSVSDAVGLFDLVSSSLRAARAGLAVSLTSRAIETDFSAPEFLEGATAAYHAVHAAVGGQAWGDLRGMVAPALADAAQGLVGAAAAEGLAVSLEVEPSVRAEIDTMTLLSADLVASIAAGGRRGAEAGAAQGEGEREEGGGLDGGQASPSSASASASTSGAAPPSPFNPDLSGRHQAMHVRFSGGAVTLRLAAAHGAVAAAAAAGLAKPRPPTESAVLEVTDRRARVWVFERGPLPAGLPVRDTQLPWRVLAIEH
jgi:hypothetical protein